MLLIIYFMQFQKAIWNQITASFCLNLLIMNYSLIDCVHQLINTEILFHFPLLFFRLVVSLLSIIFPLV